MQVANQKTCGPIRGKGEKIVRYFANDEFDEAKWVIARLKELHDQEHRKVE